MKDHFHLIILINTLISVLMSFLTAGIIYGGSSFAGGVRGVPVNPVPSIDGINPIEALINEDLSLGVNGYSFVNESVVRLNGVSKATHFVDETNLIATIPSGDLGTAGAKSITVFNPAPGGGTSNTLSLNILANPYPAPTITNIFPTEALGDVDISLTINGTNFVPNSVVEVSQMNNVTNSWGQAYLNASKIVRPRVQMSPGVYTVEVVNPAPGGGISNAAQLVFNNPIPSVSSIIPSSTPRNSLDTIITVTGTNFNNNSVVRFNNVAITTQQVPGSKTMLKATIPAADLTIVGVKNITVFNPIPGGGGSNTTQFTVTP